MSVIQLRRRSGGRRNNGTKSDFRVYLTNKRTPGNNRPNLGVRLSSTILKKVRWIAGDCVTLDFEPATSTFTMRRVADDSGNALSEQGKKGSDLTVRYALEPEDVPQFGLESGSGYDCDLVVVTGDAVLFKRS